MLSVSNALGASWADTGMLSTLTSLATNLAVLNHALVPFRRRARYMRLTKTTDQVLDYAAGGFHVSVTRGLCGGSSDSAAGFADGGTAEGTCENPLGRTDLREAWASAATAYKEAYNVANAGAPVEEAKAVLYSANSLADAAYALEGVAPPRDPGAPADPDPIGAPDRRWVSYAGLGALAIALGVGMWWIGRTPKTRKNGKAKRRRK